MSNSLFQLSCYILSEHIAKYLHTALHGGYAIWYIPLKKRREENETSQSDPLFMIRISRSPRKFINHSLFCLQRNMSSVQDVVASSPIVVFSSSSCPYCSSAIAALRENGRSPKVIEVSSAQRSELRQLTGQTSVPSIWVKGKYVGGCNDGPEGWMGIKKIIKNNKLDELLA